jgi:pimeloyl-ACP methyl ester carboxylesterase
MYASHQKLRRSNVELGRKSHPTWGEEEFPAWAEAKAQVDPNALPNYVIPWRDSLVKIQAPTLIVHGEARMGSLVSQDLAREARGLNTLVVTAEITGAGHNTRRENFEGYLQAVRAFLGRS